MSCIMIDVIAKALVDVLVFITGILRSKCACFCHFLTAGCCLFVDLEARQYLRQFAPC
jgi:hypothetical protein